ncbi:amino acid ABC transporter permease [Paraphotobacterium marinum]|uniref:Amino acid ABC transporter permease n=1 Tax=Paraphotobacterium marinum TaxID=1755811 RepID=A0A220VEK3_9GAMM|nr:amino acid ABC transporter permease [Paraphotobacterium marinum]ASK78656.1 amino acid ABC transporter permease [Paraphotobacterium marinum]
MKLIYNQKARAIFFQIICVIIICYFFYYILNNTFSNLSSRGITTGFDFLSEKSGFGISQSLIDYSENNTYGDTFLVGLLNTVLVSILGIFFATILGFLIGITKMSNNWLLKKLATCYIEIFRNVPLLLQIFFWYFAVLQTLPSPRNSFNVGESVFLNVRGLYLPSLDIINGYQVLLFSIFISFILIFIWYKYVHYYKNKTGKEVPALLISLFILICIPLISIFTFNIDINVTKPILKGFNFSGGISLLPELTALLIALSLYTASFIAEIVRSGITSISLGQWEAAYSIGLKKNKILKLIIIPQALRVIIPPLTSQYLNLTKNSSLAMAIGYPDLVSVFAGTTLNQTGQAIEIIFMTMGVYLTLSLLTSVIMNIYNKKISLIER